MKPVSESEALGVVPLETWLRADLLPHTPSFMKLGLVPFDQTYFEDANEHFTAVKLADTGFSDST